MPDGEMNTDQESTELLLDSDQTRRFSLVPSQNILPEEQKQDQDTLSPSIFKMLQRFAERRAITDSQRLQDYTENEQYITLDSRQLDRRIRDFAEADIPNEFLRDDSVSGYEALFDVYENTYRTQLQERTQLFEEWITTVRGHKEQQLRKLLSQDRLDVKTRSRGDWHARDLVLLRLLQVYYPGHLEQVGVNELLTHHALIDQYERFVLDTEARKEVIWPEDSFRS